MAAPQADNNDADSALGEDIDHESTTSVLEVPQFTENGRTYYGQEYPLPNDELEKDRLDFQHEIFCITFDGKLHLDGCRQWTQLYRKFWRVRSQA